MTRLVLSFFLVVAAALAVPGPARAGPPDESVSPARTKLLEVLLAEEQVDERAKAVTELAALDVAASARALLEALDSLATRTAQWETRAAKSRQDYEPYSGASQNDKQWAIKKRLLEQMEKDDAVLRGDAAVEQAFVAAFAGLKDKESLGLLDRAVAKDELVHARLALYAGLLRNPATNAADLGRRALADQDPTVRLAALGAFAERKDKALVDATVKVLADPNWAFRRCAVKALAAIGDARAVQALVAAMAAEEGRLLEDYADALTQLTNEALGPNPDSWKRWYEEHKAELAAKGAAVKPPALPKLGKGANPLLPPVDYYGIQTRSLKLLFLIDCSGSMNEVIGHAGVTTGEQWQGPKIEIAKRMLKAAVSQLHPSTMFNVITFNTDARQFNEALIPATPENKYATNSKIDELGGRGGTWTYGALKLAFGLADDNATPARPPVDTIFLLSDGAPTEPTFEEAVEAKPMDPAKILDSVKQWNPFRAVTIHTVAIDPRIEKNGATFVKFMRELAAQNGGTNTEIGTK